MLLLWNVGKAGDAAALCQGKEMLELAGKEQA